MHIKQNKQIYTVFALTLHLMLTHIKSSYLLIQNIFILTLYKSIDWPPTWAHALNVNMESW